MNDVIFIVIAIGIVIGGVAWIIDKNSDYGRKFEEGIMMMGPLASSMVGYLSVPRDFVAFIHFDCTLVSAAGFGSGCVGRYSTLGYGRISYCR